MTLRSTVPPAVTRKSSFFVITEAGQYDGDLVDARRKIEELIFPLLHQVTAVTGPPGIAGEMAVTVRAREHAFRCITYNADKPARVLSVQWARERESHDEQDRRSKSHCPPRLESCAARAE